MADDKEATSGAEAKHAGKHALATLITALAALIAASVPVTAWINGYYSLKLEREKFEASTRLNYLDRALANKEPESRRKFLSFLTSTLKTDDPIYRWARTEERADNEILALRESVAKAANALREFQKRTTLAALSSEKSHRDELLRLKMEKTSLEGKLRAAEQKAGVQGTVREQSLEETKPGITSANRRDVDIATKPEITDAIRNRFVIGISGRGFGSRVGQVEMDTGLGARIIEWSDTSVRVSVPGPRGSSFESLRLTTADGESATAVVSPGPSF